MKTNYESFSDALEAKSVAESWQLVEKGGRKGKRQRGQGPEGKSRESLNILVEKQPLKGVHREASRKDELRLKCWLKVF